MQSGTSLLDRLDQQITKSKQAAIAARDPWRFAVERLKGRLDPIDGVERITSSGVADALEIPQRARTSATARRIAKLMRESGWAPIRVRSLRRGANLEKIRGFARYTNSDPIRQQG